jgi:hypothetical protein
VSPIGSLFAQDSAGVSAGPSRLSWLDKASAWMAVPVLALTVAAYALVPRVVRHSNTFELPYAHLLVREYVLLAGAFVAFFAALPAAGAAIAPLRRAWRPAFTGVTLAAVCVFLCGFIVQVGRHQFGGFDYSILIEIGWRQWLGQLPYVDFVVATPPGFNLPIKYAYQLLGPSWDAGLYLCCLFSCATFLWSYWLLRRLALGGLAALVAAFAIQSGAMLVLCFWWYNNSALIMAAVFLLACLALAREADSVPLQWSYAAALVLVALMKVNIAGVMVAGGVLLLVTASERRVRVVLLTLGAAAVVAGVFALEHVSVGAMLANYRSVSKERGGLSIFGFRQLGLFEERAAVVWVLALALPLLGLVPRGLEQLRRRAWPGVASLLFFPLGVLVTVYGLMTNGEFREVECTTLIVAAAVVSFGMRVPAGALQRFIAALLCAGIVGNLYVGAERMRVYTIGAHEFFEFDDNEHRVAGGFLKGMRIAGTLVEIQREIAAARGAGAAPFFLGPRVDFDYAVLGLPAPEHFPAWWHPGTAFGREQVPQLVEVWQQHRFQTLIFLKGDYTFYPPALLEAIRRDYVRDDRYPEITVYHRRPGV